MDFTPVLHRPREHEVPKETRDILSTLNGLGLIVDFAGAVRVQGSVVQLHGSRDGSIVITVDGLRVPWGVLRQHLHTGDRRHG